MYNLGHCEQASCSRCTPTHVLPPHARPQALPMRIRPGEKCARVRMKYLYILRLQERTAAPQAFPLLIRTVLLLSRVSSWVCCD